MTKLKFEQFIPETTGTNLPDNQILTFTLVHSQSRDWILEPLNSLYYFRKVLLSFITAYKCNRATKLG